MTHFRIRIPISIHSIYAYLNTLRSELSTGPLNHYESTFGCTHAQPINHQTDTPSYPVLSSRINRFHNVADRLPGAERTWGWNFIEGLSQPCSGKSLLLLVEENWVGGERGKAPLRQCLLWKRMSVFWKRSSIKQPPARYELPGFRPKESQGRLGSAVEREKMISAG